MKPRNPFLLSAILLSFSSVAHAAPIYKNNNTGDLNQLTSWSTTSGAQTPNPTGLTASDVWYFNEATMLGTKSVNLGGDMTIGGLAVDWATTSTVNNVTIGTSSNTLTLAGATISGTGVSGGAGYNTAGIVLNRGTGGTLTINSNVAISASQSWVQGRNGLTVNGAVALGANTLTLNIAAGTATLAGAVTGSGAMVKSGGNTLSLSGATTLTSTGDSLSIGAGTVSVTATGSIVLSGALKPSSANTKGTLNIASGGSVSAASMLSSWGTTMGLNGTLNIAGTMTFSGGTSTVTGTGTAKATKMDNTNFGITNLNGARFNIGSGGVTSNTTLNLGATTFGAFSDWTSPAALILTDASTGTIFNTLDSVDGTTARTIILNGVLSGTGKLVKSSAGMLTLQGANTFTGGLTINAGTVRIGGTGTLGNGTYAGAIANEGVLSFNSTAATQTLSGIISGGGSLVKAASSTGTLILTGENSYTGTTTISAGTLAVNGLINVSAVSVASGATLRGTGGVAGPVTIASGTANLTGGDGTSGKLLLNNVHFEGSGVINVGTLSNYTAEAAIEVVGELLLSGAPGSITLNLGAAPVSAGTYHLISAPGLADLSAFTLGTLPTLSSRQTATLSQADGFVNYVVSGSNPTWSGALSSEWTYATQDEPKNWALPGAVTTDYIDGDLVTFDDTASNTAVNLAVFVAPGSVLFNNSDKTYTLLGDGGIANTATLTKSGTGLLTIGTNNSHTGGTTINGGTLAINSANALGPSALTFGGNGTLQLNASIFGTNNYTLANGASGTVNTNGFDLSHGGVISGAGTLVKSGTGSLLIGTRATYTGGTIVNGGVLSLVGGGGDIGAIRGTATVNTGGTLRLATADATGYNGGATALTTINLVGGALNVGVTANQTLGNAVINLTGGSITGVANSNLDFFGGSSAINTLASSTTSTISGTALDIRQSTGLNVTVAAGTTASGIDLDVTSLITNQPPAGGVAGTGTSYGAYKLSKLGAGKMRLSGVNNWSGGTELLAGTISVSAMNSMGTGYLAVKNGATFQYTGTGETRSGVFWLDTGSAVIEVTDPAATLTFWRTGGGHSQLLRKTGTGTLRYGANGDNNGATAQVDAGVLESISSANNNLSTVTVNSGGTFRLGTTDGSGAAITADHQIFNGAVLTLNAGSLFSQNGMNETVGTLVLNGGTISGAGVLTSANAIDARSGTASTILAGTLGLAKTTAGTVTLGAANTYTGNTTVSAGSLVLADNAQLRFVIGANGVSNKITGAGTVDLAGDFNLDLTGAAAVAGNSWILVDSTLTKTYESTFTLIGFAKSGGIHTMAVSGGTWTFTESTGALTFSSGGYSTWATANAPGQTAAQDYDNDGVPNGIEYVLGGSAATSDLSKLPHLTASSGDLIFTFIRSQASKTSDTTASIEVGTTLGAWPTTYPVPNTPVTANPGVSVVDNGNGTDTVTLTIPKGSDTKKFARLKVGVN